jgi:hypothetical protein
MAMADSKRGPAPHLALKQALTHLHEAEIEILAAVHEGSHPKKALLLEAHSLVWEAVSTLMKATVGEDQPQK